MTEMPNEPLLFTLIVGNGESSNVPEGEEVGQFDCGGCNHGVYRLEEGYKMFVSNPEGQLCCTFTAHKQFSQCKATLYGTPEQGSFGLNNAIMIMLAFAGAMQGILLMHASVPMLHDKAYLCLGKSGTGKSTHTRLWLENIEGSDLLNDDNPVVRVIDGDIIIYGSPWSGKTPCYKNRSLPLQAVVRLSQAPFNRITRLAPLQAYAALMPSCSCMRWDHDSVESLHRTVEKVIMKVPVRHLECLPDADAAHTSHEACRPKE
jgi:hypothetical protein